MRQDLALLRAVLTFERGLRVGSQCRVKWTLGHGCYVGHALVSKIETRYFVVKLMRAVRFRDSTAEFPIGHLVRVPRYRGGQWSWSQFNRVEPFPDGYQLAVTEK